MKKYLLLVLVLLIFALPAFSQAVVKGNYRYGGVWNIGEEEYIGDMTRFRFPVEAKIDDYNQFKSRFANNGLTKTAPVTEYGYVITDWGKFFKLDEMGFGLKTTIGRQNTTYQPFEPSRIGSYTMYALDAFKMTEGEISKGGQDDGPAGGGNLKSIQDTPAIRADFDIMGIFQPYFVTSFRAFDASTTTGVMNQGDDIKEFYVGTNVVYKPVRATVYYGQNGEDKGGQSFGFEAQYRDKVTEDVDLTVGSIFAMVNDAADDWYWYYTFGAGASAYGATVEAYARGMKDDVFQRLYTSASYDILAYLGAEAGMQLAFGDNNNDEVFAGAEFGLYVKPGKSTYTLGYVINNEDSGLYRKKSSPTKANPAKGGVYFTLETNF